MNDETSKEPHGWQPIESAPKHLGDRYAVLYYPALDNDEEYPGLPVAASNPDFVNSGNARKAGATLWFPIPALPPSED
jgi:hypothetical protein